MSSSNLDARDRVRTFEKLESTPFDLLVIGGGISGAGVARDAAMRGLRVCLVEARDFASGTSSRSSKMIHGGLRYLAQGDIGLVNEAATERKTLREIAPHLATTLPMVITSKKKTGLAKIRAGLWTYEKLGKVASNEKHDALDAKALSAFEPALKMEGIAGAVLYPEYVTDDARLTLANARSAAAAGAVIATYASVEDILLENGKAVGAKVKGTLPGESLTATISAKVTVNAAGPWVDAIRRLEDATAQKKMQLTKGIHLVFKKSRLPVNSSVIMTTPDKRSIFTCPREDYVYLGTTDTFYADTDYVPEITDEDVDYLLNTANATFNIDPLTREDVVSLWSGVRPLIGEEGKSPSEISRKDEILEGTAGVLTLAGGKLTAYRVMAQKTVDLCEERLGKSVSPCTTADKALPGGNLTGTFEEEQAKIEEKGLTPVEAERILRLYGTEAPDLLSHTDQLTAEVTQAVEKEGALRLEDYWIRRSARARFSDDGGLSCLAPAAEIMSTLLDWSEDRKTSEIEHCLAIRARERSALAEANEQTQLSGVST